MKRSFEQLLSFHSKRLLFTIVHDKRHNESILGRPFQICSLIPSTTTFRSLFMSSQNTTKENLPIERKLFSAEEALQRNIREGDRVFLQTGKIFRVCVVLKDQLISSCPSNIYTFHQYIFFNST